MVLRSWNARESQGEGPNWTASVHRREQTKSKTAEGICSSENAPKHLRGENPLNNYNLSKKIHVPPPPLGIPSVRVAPMRQGCQDFSDRYDSSGRVHVPPLPSGIAFIKDAPAFQRGWGFPELSQLALKSANSLLAVTNLFDRKCASVSRL